MDRCVDVACNWFGQNMFENSSLEGQLAGCGRQAVDAAIQARRLMVLGRVVLLATMGTE